VGTITSYVQAFVEVQSGFHGCVEMRCAFGLYDAFGNRSMDSFHVFGSRWNLGMYGRGFGGAATVGWHGGGNIAEFEVSDENPKNR
jgi:hypothetical protein